jgi:cysteinyl-tRNA synthetase
MSKSTGNFYTIQDALKRHHPEVVRYFLLSSHYRSPLNYSEDNLHNANKALIRLYQSLKGHDIVDGSTISEEWLSQFNQAMNDDINTPVALSILFSLSHELNRTGDVILAATLKKLGGVLGLLQDSPEVFLQSGLRDTDTETVENLINERLQARAEKNWQRADEIRATLLGLGIELEDGSSGTTWRRRLEQ